MRAKAKTCDLVADALLDPAAPRPSGMETHLDSCSACRAVREGHLSALGLRDEVERAPRAIRMEQVLVRVQRRRRTRLAAGAASAAAVALAMATWSPREAPERARSDDLFALVDRVGSYADRELAAEDPVLLACAPMLEWLAPPPRRSLELPSFSTSPESAAAPGDASP